MNKRLTEGDICAKYDKLQKEFVLSKHIGHHCHLSAELKALVEPMLANLLQMEYPKDAFEKFFAQSKRITSLRYIYVIDFHSFDFFNVALDPSQK